MLHKKISLDLGDKIFNKTKIGLALVSKKGEFLRANEELCRILGYSEAELQEKTFAELTDPRDYKGDQSMLEQVLLGNIDEYAMLKRYITKNGKLVWATLIVAGIYEDDEEVAFFFSQIIPEDNSFFQKIQEKSDDEDESAKTSSNSLENKFIAWIKKDWKYIIVIIGAMITYEVNRRTTAFEKELEMQKVVETSEANAAAIDRINTNFEKMYDMLLEQKKDEKDE